MGEAGLSAAEVGKEIAEHTHRNHRDDGQTKHERRLTVVEAILLAVVALLAAWSGYASAKWSTESRLALSRGSTARTEASAAANASLSLRQLDSSAFEAWFTAYVADDEAAMALAVKRFRPEMQVAFDAWMATDPITNPDAPKGPLYMDEYEDPMADQAVELNRHADELYQEGSDAGETADEYVRTTVFLATVLFLVGISGQFRVPAARFGLVAVGGVILVLSLGLLLTSPFPPF